MMFIATALVYLITYVLWILAAPCIVIGYITSFIWAFAYYGWTKADKHQGEMVKIYDKRNSPGGE